MKLALPKGRLMAETIRLMESTGLGLSGYREEARVYHLASDKFAGVSAKIFHEKDIPIQVAIGNYDLGICGEDWANELLARYPASSVVKVSDLGYGNGLLYAASYSGGEIKSLSDLSRKRDTVQIASEYPNLAESLAGKLRLRRFKIYPLWGAAEAYPPETADIVLVLKNSEREVGACGLRPLSKITGVRAYLIANRKSLESSDMGGVISAICNNPICIAGVGKEPVEADYSLKPISSNAWGDVADDTVKLALPDGHQQAHVSKILNTAGVKISDYPSESGVYRPRISLPGVVTKVIRPQDMPVQVANGNFDLGVTGRDWLTDHLYQFPGSPVKELLNLKYGRVRVVAAISNEQPVNDTRGLRELYARDGRGIRIASEYVNLADSYARMSHLGSYRVIPTWGTTEAFIPEDADLLIENTETGKTLAQNNLKIIDTLFESTACLIGSKAEIANKTKRDRINSITEILRKAVEAL